MKQSERAPTQSCLNKEASSGVSKGNALAAAGRAEGVGSTASARVRAQGGPGRAAGVTAVGSSPPANVYSPHTPGEPRMLYNLSGISSISIISKY